MKAIFQRIIRENTIIKDIEHKILDINYIKLKYLFGIRIFEHNFISNQTIEDKKVPVGFKPI